MCNFFFDKPKNVANLPISNDQPDGLAWSDPLFFGAPPLAPEEGSKGHLMMLKCVQQYLVIPAILVLLQLLLQTTVCPISSI